MHAICHQAASASDSTRYRLIAIAVFLIATGACASAAETQPSRAWDFDLTKPGSYSVQIQHHLSGIAPVDSRVRYTITVGEQTQSREHELISGRPFVALRLDSQGRQHMRVVVSGLPQVALQNTRVDLLDETSLKSDQHAQTAEGRDTEEIQAVRNLLQAPDGQLDLGRVKVALDKLIDPTVDETGTLQQLDAMVSAVRLTPDFGNNGDVKVRALRRYLYESNAENGYRPFQYDLTDPLGHDIRNKLLSNYLTTRKGNCVTMPLLFVILGQRLGIDVTIAMAPKHLLVKFNSDEYGRWINLEATSGANPARDVWIPPPLIRSPRANAAIFSTWRKTMQRGSTRLKRWDGVRRQKIKQTSICRRSIGHVNVNPQIEGEKDVIREGHYRRAACRSAGLLPHSVGTLRGGGPCRPSGWCQSVHLRR